VGISAQKRGTLQDPWLQSNLRQAENLRIAQERVAALEREVHELRKENELLVTAAEFSRQKMEELNEKVFELEKAKNQALEQAQIEMNVYRENLFQRDKDLERTKMKLEELETKFQRDLNRVRVRERELENRLELTRAEKNALLAAKDEKILDLKKKHDLLKQELEHSKSKFAALQAKSAAQQDQMARVIKTLRLALTHLESQSGGASIHPLKKAD
jgi:chromosome segregation ATPase